LRQTVSLGVVRQRHFTSGRSRRCQRNPFEPFSIRLSFFRTQLSLPITHRAVEKSLGLAPIFQGHVGLLELGDPTSPQPPVGFSFFLQQNNAPPADPIHTAITLFTSSQSFRTSFEVYYPILTLLTSMCALFDATTIYSAGWSTPTRRALLVPMPQLQ